MLGDHRVVAAIRRARPCLSFEFSPPRDAAGTERLLERIGALEEVTPDFVSVTYGAGGSAAARAGLSVRLTEAITALGGPRTMAHLTLVGHTREELARIVGELVGAGADAVLALRGDPPEGPVAPWRGHPEGFAHAVDLVRLVVAAGHDAGVAAFPHGHPASADPAQDIAVLAEKERAGAAFAITQMVFSAAPYLDLVARARRAGIGLPLVPGIMPVSATGQVPRLEVFSGAPLPGELAAGLERAGEDPDAQAEVGIDWAVGLVRELLAAGAPGIHLYTLNRSDSALEVCRRAGLRGRP